MNRSMGRDFVEVAHEFRRMVERVCLVELAAVDHANRLAYIGDLKAAGQNVRR